MTPEVAVPLLLLAGLVGVLLVAFAVWRLAFRSLYPNCTCVVCGTRTPAERAKRGPHDRS